MTQPIFSDMLLDNGPDSTSRFPFPQVIGTSLSESYTGPYLPHDGFRPEGVLFPEEPRGTYMTDEALRLAQGVANRVIQVAIHGPTLLEQPTEIDEGTYMSRNAVNLAQALHRDWLIQLRKPVPSQEFPLDQVA